MRYRATKKRQMKISLTRLYTCHLYLACAFFLHGRRRAGAAPFAAQARSPALSRTMLGSARRTPRAPAAKLDPAPPHARLPARPISDGHDHLNERRGMECFPEPPVFERAPDYTLRCTALPQPLNGFLAIMARNCKRCVHCGARCSGRAASAMAAIVMAAAPEVGPRVPSRSPSKGAVLASKL